MALVDAYGHHLLGTDLLPLVGLSTEGNAATAPLGAVPLT